ncbi:AtpZ/AtpI family protein [Pseudaestuariivita sp.]|uniref:AtpZ/AtpI family protein n=1 Tax=Pseudaestuariivita sp. TaxID=2211669 RepID=UPI004058F0E7
MSDADDPSKLRELEAKIDALKAQNAPRTLDKPVSRQSELGWRMVTELVAGLIIGLGIGYGLDSLLGTLPIFLVLFTLLGFAAGVNVMLRSAKELQEKSQPEPRSDDETQSELGSDNETKG